jgi:hypothetical protein
VKIVLNTFTQRMDGSGTIPRTSRLSMANLVIGRSTECDIQLPDLAVGLTHATMTEIGEGRIRVTAVGSQKFQVDGRFARDARLMVADRPTLQIGAFELKIGPGASAGEIEITVTRKLDSMSAQQLDAQVRRLAPEVVGFRKRTLSWTLAAILLVVCVILPTAGALLPPAARVHADQQWSPGRLSGAHLFLERDCAACHAAPFVPVRDRSCLHCHEARQPPEQKRAIAARVLRDGATEPLVLVREHADHARLLRAIPAPADRLTEAKRTIEDIFDHAETRCVGCHREHVATVTTAAPAASPPDTGEKMRAAGPSLIMVRSCTDCHQSLSRRLPDTAIANVGDWARHPDFRPRVVNPDASIRRLSSVGPWSAPSGLVFSHRLHLLPSGAVARYGRRLGPDRGYGGSLNCSSCHRPDRKGDGFKPIQMARDCQACHVLAFPGRGGNAVPLTHGRVAGVIGAVAADYDGGATVPPLTGSSTPQTQASPAAQSVIRGVFSRGGACFGCHTVLAPSSGSGTDFQIASVRLTRRVLPSGGFNHGVPAHRCARSACPQSPAPDKTCQGCHPMSGSDTADALHLPHIAACRTCHGKLDQRPPLRAGTACTECHGFHDPGTSDLRRGVADAAIKPSPVSRLAARVAPSGMRGSQ